MTKIPKILQFWQRTTCFCVQIMQFLLCKYSYNANFTKLGTIDFQYFCGIIQKQENEQDKKIKLAKCREKTGRKT